MSSDQVCKRQFIDTHCHIDFPGFDHDRDQVLENCRKQGICNWVVPSVGRENWQRVLKLKGAVSGVSVALGIHPCFLENADLSHLDELAGLLRANRDKLVAVGEIGLDRAVNIPLARQQEYFRDQLALAAEQKLAVMLHSRRMNDEIVAGLKYFQIERGVLHGFSGSLQQARKIWSLGVRLGVGGVITYARAKKTRAALAVLPLQALVLETDSPDMPVCGFQGQRNTPERLPLIFNALCKLRPEDPQKIAEELYWNSVDTFNLPLTAQF